MSAENERSRPDTTPDGPNAQQMTPAIATSDGTSTSPEVLGSDHPSQLALDAADPWVRASWRTAVETDAAAGYLFSADDTQVRYGLADLGNATGGVFMAAAKAGRIEKAGYRPSRKPGRNGGIVAVWRGVAGR